MTKRFNQYVGKAGHLYIMSEFLMRGWNVAIPEVDVGDDIFVVQDSNGILRRVQVKTSTSTVQKSAYSGQFSAKISNLRNINTGFVYYIFITRHLGNWSAPLIIRQDYLLDHIDNHQVGTLSGKSIVFYFSYANNHVTCSKQNFSGYVRDFSDFPQLDH